MHYRQAKLLLLTGFATLACGLAIVRPADPSPSALDNAWENGAKLLHREALKTFEEAASADDSSSLQAAFGQALMLLNVPPKSESKIQHAADLLDKVASGAQGELAALALYFRARIEQTHRYVPDHEQAVALYSELIEKHPSHFFAQYAMVKRAMIEFYDDSPLETKASRIQLLDDALPQITHLPARRDMHLLLAITKSRFFDDDQAVLQHLISADDLGIVRRQKQASVYVQIGELARKLNQHQLAATYYKRFLNNFPRDNRFYTVKLRLESLKSEF